VKLRLMSTAVIALTAVMTPAFSQGVAVSPAVTQAGPAATAPGTRPGGDAQAAPTDAAALTRAQQAERAGYACPDRAWPDSVCQTPTATKPK